MPQLFLIHFIIAVSWAGQLVLAATDDPVDFETQVRPLLMQHCAKCHGAAVQKKGLRLDAKQAAFKGGDYGAVILPGKADESELFRRITTAGEDRMPPEGKPLSADDIELLKRWLTAGAVWPETDYDREAAHDSRLDHWAWQPMLNVLPPKLPADIEPSVANNIDRFILAKLAEKKLALSPETDRRTLIRRLSFDLHGLPPTPEDVAFFVNDSAPLALERLVDRLLASEHYGERWARHWLDIAHYADTHGFERDQRRDNAWHYRDWVIKAINADLPYDQFLRDQIAGDVLRPDDSEAVAATGFLAAGPWDFVGQVETPSPVLKRLARADDLDDMVTQVMTATCGITVNCARCHDHKLDPISQREYYALWAVFAGVKRGDRILSSAVQDKLTTKKLLLEGQLTTARTELWRVHDRGWSLADVVGGGNGFGSGKTGSAIDPLSGSVTEARRGFLDAAPTNQFIKSSQPFIDGVVIPDGGESGNVPITSTGILAAHVPDTSGKAWDAIRNGPVNSQFSTELSGLDFTKNGHTLLSLHANSAITFDLSAMRAAGLSDGVHFSAQVGYFGQTPRSGAGFHVFLDGQLQTAQQAVGRDDGLIAVDIPIAATARFLTLMATDNGNDIGHDQICFADAALSPPATNHTPDELAAITTLKQRIGELQQQLDSLPISDKIYAINAETPPPIHVLLRGNPEQPDDEVTPGTVSCVSMPASLGTADFTDAQRRIALADWIVSPQNPLPARVIVNRLWHHHFGVGIVDTPSDFGMGGSRPSHPELLDWLASQLQANKWSLKSIHRLICLSATYRQASSRATEDLGSQHSVAQTVDVDNRDLWRQNIRRLDAESLRDAVLAVSGKLDKQMFGPGYQDFDYKEEYAPVYTYITADRPALWRRSIYRFVVRTSPDPFLATLDCPNAANLSPTRNVTTTALQSLAMLNNEFMLKQTEYFAARLVANPNTTLSEQVSQAFLAVFGRLASTPESEASIAFIQSNGTAKFCRALLNANEFVYID